MNIVIITGGSKGIGNALATTYTSEGYTVFSLARSKTIQAYINDVLVDLLNLTTTIEVFKSLLSNIEQEFETITSFTLINNAGRLGNISNLENIPIEDISQTIQLNTTTPLILSNLFIKFSKKFSCNKTIINISSGASVKPYAGWSVYCNSKAAIDMLTSCIHEEQKEFKNGVKTYGIRPGVVDTNMQTTIRSTNEINFKLKERFVKLKKNNQLFDTKLVANTIFKLVAQNNLTSGETIDLRDFI